MVHKMDALIQELQEFKKICFIYLKKYIFYILKKKQGHQLTYIAHSFFIHLKSTGIFLRNLNYINKTNGNFIILLY